MLASRSVRMGSCLSGLSKVCAAPAAAAARRHAHTVEEASFELPPFKLHHLEPAQGPPTHTVLTRADALQHYRDMVVIRRLETVAANMYKEKAIRGFCHLSSGQEAVAAGMKAALRPNDSVITSYRCHGIVHMLGVPVVNVLAELAGHKSGCSRGKGGSMHMYGPNFYGGNGIVGAQVPLGAGIGLAHKYKGDGGVCYAMYGDGAANQGQVFEAFNMAQLWHLPVVFLCENNHYGMGTAQDRASASVTFYTRGDYIPGVQIDGMDVLAVKEACKFAAEYCSSDKGPLVFEMVTYRYHGHSMSDPGTSYRTRDEVQDMRQKKDPITGYREKIVAAGLADLDELKEIEMEVKKQTDADVKKAKADTEIDAVELSYDVYENNLHGLLRGRTVFETLEHKNTRRGINAA